MNPNIEITIEIKGCDLFDKWQQVCKIGFANKLVKGWSIEDISSLQGGKEVDKYGMYLGKGIDTFTIKARKIK